jgi:hypothetical protein
VSAGAAVSTRYRCSSTGLATSSSPPPFPCPLPSPPLPSRPQLESRADCDSIQDALQELTGARSVPRVFVGGQFIGGGDDTARKAANGELERLLKAAGAI